MKYSVDLLSVGAILVIIGIMVIAFRHIKAKNDHSRYLEELAEMEFEQSVLGTNLSSIPGPEEPYSQFINQPASQPESAAAPLFQPNYHAVESAVPGAGAESPDFLMNSVIKKLEVAGLLRDVDGYQELHNNPKGVAILRLRNGSTALLIPHFESEAFMKRNAKRADYIIQCDGQGNAYVFRPIAEFIAENISAL